MNTDAPVDEKAIIERALAAVNSTEPTIPRADVKRFLAKVGEEIQQAGELRQEVVDRLLQQLHNGEV